MQQAVPAAPPAPARAPAPFELAQDRSASAADVYVAMKNQRSELRSQLESLERRRSDLANQLQADDTPAEVKPGIVARIKEVDAQISGTDQQLAQANAQVAKAASVPGAIVEPPRIVRNGPPEDLIAIPIIFTLAVLMPIAIAHARRIWKKGATVIAPVPNEVRARLDQLSDAVESIGLEVERIGEGQRFMTRVLTEHNAKTLGAGAAQPIPMPQHNREYAAVPRAE